MKTKILHIQVLPKLSGVQRVSLEIMKSLPDSQYDKWILFSDSTDVGDREQCEREFRRAGVRVIYSNKMKRAIGLSDIGAVREIYRLCRRERFDIVHTHSTKPGVVGRIAATLARTPRVIHTVHGLAFHKFVGLPRWLFYWGCEMFASLFCDRIILVNRYYSKYFKWCARKVSTVYNGIDFSAYPGHLPVSQKGTTPRILFVGRLDTPKDPLTFLEAAKILIGEYPDAKFTMVGDGEKYGECKRFIRDNGLTASIDLAGWQQDVSSFYVSHDIFAMSSIYESFGLIFVEAAHYGLPVVATNVEGIPEVVSDGETGLLCNPRDPQALAKNMMTLIRHPELRDSFGQAARKRAYALFTSELMTDRYKKVYRQQRKMPVT